MNTGSLSGARYQVDEGLRRYFNNVYMMMAAGLVVSGVTGYMSLQSPAMIESVIEFRRSSGFISLVVMFSPMIITMMAFNPYTFMRFSAAALGTFFLLFSAYWGWLFSLSLYMVAFENIARVFFITASMFAAMSVWGYTTKSDLGTLRSALQMAFLGLFISLAANIFIGSSMMMQGICAAGVVIYSLMTAYDTQLIRREYDSVQAMHNEIAAQQLSAKMAVFGALRLYINFIMLFQYIMSFMNQR